MSCRPWGGEELDTTEQTDTHIIISMFALPKLFAQNSYACVCEHAKSLQLCLTVCGLMDCNCQAPLLCVYSFAKNYLCTKSNRI